MQTHVYVLHVSEVYFKLFLDEGEAFCFQEWHDSSLTWSPEDFGDIEFIHIPSDFIWKPDLVLYNSKDSRSDEDSFVYRFIRVCEDADGSYQITSRSKAQVRYDGTVRWVGFFFFSLLDTDVLICSRIESTDDLQILLFHRYSILSV